MKKTVLYIFTCFIVISPLFAQKVDYSVVSVNEESGLNFTKITNDNDAVCMPIVKRSMKNCTWFTNRIIGLSPDGKYLAFLSARDNTTNIFIKEPSKQGGSIQRTHRQSVLDFNYSPDGKYLTFSEKNGRNNQIFQTDAKSGYVCRQITNGSLDYSPVYSHDMNLIYFARQEMSGTSIWSQNVKDNFLSTYTSGMNPCPCSDNKSVICVRTEAAGNSSIWKVNSDNGIEECIVSDPNKNYSTPSISPDGKWLLFVGSSAIPVGVNGYYYNTDIYVCHLDGTNLMQLTYHAADDLSPIWSNDGKSIYFISQRGNSEGKANIWRMNFDL